MVNRKTGQSTSKGIKLRNLKGRVVDQDGEPIIGASVLVKGTTNGVITDMDGNYNLIDVPAKCITCLFIYRLSDSRVESQWQRT